MIRKKAWPFSSGCSIGITNASTNPSDHGKRKSNAKRTNIRNGWKYLKYLNVNSSSLPIFYSSVSCSRSWLARGKYFAYSIAGCCRLQKDTRTSRIYSSLTRFVARNAASTASWISEFVIYPRSHPVFLSRWLCSISSWHRFAANQR